jgi:hypothetical protein
MNKIIWLKQLNKLIRIRYFEGHVFIRQLELSDEEYLYKREIINDNIKNVRARHP